MSVVLASQWEEEEKTELAGPGQTNTVITISDYFSIESKFIYCNDYHEIIGSPESETFIVGTKSD